MNVEVFVRQIETMYGRLSQLYRGVETSPAQVAQVLPIAFKELGTASEKLQLAATELLRQNKELVTAKLTLEVEHQRYTELFEFVPDAYLETDLNGMIRQANRMAATLFNVPQNLLLGKPLVLFMPPEERSNLYRELNRVVEQKRVQEWCIKLIPRGGEAFDAALTLGGIRDWDGRPAGVRLYIRDITERKRAEAALENYEYDPRQDRQLHTYTKGEIIPLQPQALWLVCQGVVKLSTLSDNSEEVIVGFAGPSTPFGSSLTALQIYQATALCDVQLVSISLSELAISPPLTQALLPKINQRLRQTELLLAIGGQRRVRERLYRLLLLLKQEIGVAVSQGIRLSVRFTHEELAAACCTTRVTITRELNQLQQQGKITLDSDRHIILRHSTF